MRNIILTIMCALSLNAMAQGIIVHETNNNQTTYKSTDVERIEFSSAVTESTSSSYATKEQLEKGLDTKVDKSEMSALEDRITVLENTVSELEKKIAELLKPSGEFEDITVNGQTYHLGTSGAVDLGLSVKWATMNVGASSPGDYGDYYAWGEKEPYYAEGHSQDDPCNSWRDGKTGYNWECYFDSNYEKYAKNKKIQLVLDDDVAHVKWGGSWRMPTKAEQGDLRDKCTWVWTTYGGHNGYVVVGSTGNAIFLPAAGYRINSDLLDAGSDGYYWSSSLGTDYSGSACDLYFGSGYVDWDDYYRYYGQSVRAVCP